MCKKLIFLITFVLLLSLTNAAWAIPFDEAKAVWNFHTDEPRADENGPPYSTLSYYYYGAMEEVTGGEAGEKWDGWAVPSAAAWWSPMYAGQPEADDIKPVGAVTFFTRVRLGDLSPEQNVISGLYDGSCTDSEYPSYGIEVHSGEPVFVVTEAGMEGTERTECFLGQDLEVDKWYDMAGFFDPYADRITIQVKETGGSLVGEASIDVDFDELFYSDYPEWQIFCSPCYNMGYAEGDGHVELVAVWTGYWPPPPPPPPRVSNPSPAPGTKYVPCDVNEVCFKPPYNAQVWDPCHDPTLLQGPFDFYVYFKADDPYNMPLAGTILNHDTNDQVCVNVGPTLPGKTYYWRVDINDHNEPGEPCFYEGPFFKFTKWGYAIYPLPYDGATDMFPSVDPNWQNDGYASHFKVYFGDDYDEVDNNDVPDACIPAGQEDEGIDPGEFAFGKTYYWRVDECNDFPGNDEYCVKGDTWSFSTRDCNLIDDFEAYTSKSIGKTWVPVKGGGTGASVDISLDGYEGEKAMELSYEFDPAKTSYVEREFISPYLNLTNFGAKLLSVVYRAGIVVPYGDDDAYIELEDNNGNTAKINMSDSPDNLNINDPCWTTWYIALDDFDTPQTPDLSKIRYIRIGATTPHDVTGSGDIEFDLLLRCAPYCVPGEGPTGDISGPEDEPDCVVDEWDLAELVARWLDEENLGNENFFQDNIIDFKDYAILAENWKEEELWPDD
ncbi:hypothetical protein ACFL1G_01965 [Planctomycetota bacterium]